MHEPNSAGDAAVKNGADCRPNSLAIILRKSLKVLASLQLTVVLFALGMILVFYATLAQIDLGIWTVVDRYFKSWVVRIPNQLTAQMGIKFFALDPNTYWSGSIQFPGGLAIASIMLANLLAAHIVRFKISWKRSGIIMIHSGIVALLVGELIAKFYAEEGNMTIMAGGSANYVEDLRHIELAIVDPSDPRFNTVTLVTDRALKKGGVIDDPKLPFSVHVDQYMVNSALVRVEQSAESRATQGYGLKYAARERPEISGTDLEQKIDLPSAYLTLRRKDNGESLGTYLVSLQLGLDPDDPLQEVVVGDMTYQITLRLKRTFKPYTIHLIKFEHSNYPGTNIPKDYTSTVRLVDPEYGEDREVKIWMNHPLRYRGDTLYQSSFFPTGNGTNGTILQVVENPAAIVPYVSCIMISLGMMVHFGMMLNRYMQRRTR
jgi:hypothetical protein